DSSPGSSGSFSYTAGEGNGSYSFYTVAADLAGNTEAAPGSADATTTVGTDGVAPSSSASATAVSGTTAINVSYSAADNAGGSGRAGVGRKGKGPSDGSYSKVASDGSPGSSGSFSYTAGEGDGSHSLV